MVWPCDYLPAMLPRRHHCDGDDRHHCDGDDGDDGDYLPARLPRRHHRDGDDQPD